MAEPTRTLIAGGVVLTLGADNHVIDDGAVLIEGSRVAAVGPAGALRAAHPDAEIIEARGRTVLPGFICAHHHLYSTFACGLAPAPSPSFVAILENLWWKLDRALTLEDVRLSALIPLARCIRAGTTTIIDHHASPNAIRGSLDVIGDEVLRAGLRASLCYEVTDRNGPGGADEGLAESEAWLERVCSDDSGRLHGLVGAHAAFTVGAATLAKCVALAERFSTGLHIHVAEDRSDQDHSLETYGKRVLVRLAEAGALGESTLAAHCIHVDETELALLAETGTIVTHQPQSYMNNGVGAARVIEMVERGIRVGLGTDGMTSDMKEEVRSALWLHHHEHRDSRVGFLEVAGMLLAENPTIASQLFGVPLGRIEVGAPADLVISEHIPFTPITPDNVLGHVIFGVAAAPIDTTIVDGRVLMRDKRLISLDWTEINRRAAELSPATWERFQNL